MIPSDVRIFVCTEPVDMRKGFDSLALAARERLGHDPLAGGLFVFAGRRPTRLKILWFDQNGYCLLYKRLHRALFRLPRRGDAIAVQIDGHELAALLAGVALPARREGANRSGDTSRSKSALTAADTPCRGSRGGGRWRDGGGAGARGGTRPHHL